MTTKKIVVSIVGTAISAGLVAAAGFYPEVKGILVAGNALVVAVIAYLVGKEA